MAYLRMPIDAKQFNQIGVLASKAGSTGGLWVGDFS